MESHQLFQGNLEDVHFPELLLEISQRKESGVLHISRHAIEKDIYFQEGHIVFAKSNDPDERLGELLLRRGKVMYERLEDAGRKIVPGMRLGTILVQEGHIKPNDLYQGVIDQVEEILYSLFEWSDGEYSFSAGELPSKEVITLSISTADIIRTGISRIWRWSWIRKGSISLDSFYVRVEMPAIAKKMMITPGLQKLLDLLAEPMSLREVLSRTGGNNFETCKMIWSLLTIGIIQHVPPTPEAPAVETILETPMPDVTSDIFSSEAVLDSVPTVLLPVPSPEPAPQPATTVEMKPAEPWIAPPPSAPTVILDLAAMQHHPLTEPPANVELSFSDFADLTDAAQVSAAAGKAAAQMESWEKNISRDVAGFNEKHRYLFEMLRIEMGAGVTNFLGKILKKASSRHALVFEGVQMNEFGELNPTNLAGNIESNSVEDYKAALDGLLKNEQETIQGLMDKKRLELIETGLARIEESQKHRK